MTASNNLSPSLKPVKNDVHVEVYKFLKVIMSMIQRCVSGGYVNFAICDFYRDESFSQLSSMVFKSILGQDLTLLAQYEKIHRTLILFVDGFLKKHLELIFIKYDPEILKEIVEKILVPGMLSNNCELKQRCLAALDFLNCFIFENFEKPNKKMPSLFGICSNTSSSTGTSSTSSSGG